MNATVWSPNPLTVTQANANGLLKSELLEATAGQRSYALESFAYAVGTGSLIIFKNGKALARNADFIEVNSSEFILAEACIAGDQVLAMGFVGITGSALVDAILRADLGESSGSNLVNFIHSGVGATSRSVLSKLRDYISVKDYGAVGDGVTDDTAAIQKALNSANVFASTIYFPLGNYRITSSLKTAIVGTVIKGASKYGVYITAPDGAVFDMIRVAHQMCSIKGFIFRPSTTTQTPIKIYAGRAVVTDNYLLAAVNNTGIGILLTDINPETGAFVPGAYAHTISENIMGDGGYAFANAITESSTQGITSCKFRANRIISNRPIQINKGGGNTYSENLLQSSSNGPTGVGITLGAEVSGEKIFANYFEGFQAMVETLNTSITYQIFNFFANHNDNNTAVVADAGSKNYILEDSNGKVENRNGWSTQYTSATRWSLYSPTAAPCISTSNTGNVALGEISGSSHIINRITSVENDVILNFKYNSNSMGYLQDARGTGINGANTGLALNKNTITNRSVNAAGTINASGADYAEYMFKAEGCPNIEKGQIVGITATGKLTTLWAEAVSFIVKSTNPSYVGNDIWADELGPRPISPNPEDMTPEEELEFATNFAAWEAELEVLRQTVDRVAIAGQVPVNVLDTVAGQFIVPVQDGYNIKGIAVTSPTFEEYLRSVGKVLNLEADGRANIIVKPV